MILLRCFCISLACFILGFKKPEIMTFATDINSGSKSTANTPNTTRRSSPAVLLPTAIAGALTGITQAKIVHSIVPMVLIDVINPKSIRYFTPKHRPDHSMNEVFGAVDTELLVHFLPELVDHPTPSFRVSGGSPPRLEMLSAGEILQASRFPSQDASFGIISEQAMKFICVGNTLARLATSEYVRLNIGSHIGHCVIADVERREVSFPSCARLISHIPSQSQFS